MLGKIVDYIKNIAKYGTTPVLVTKPPLYIYIRKRVKHKGYALLLKQTCPSLEGCYVPENTYIHLVYVDTLEQAKKYLSNEYGVEVEL